MRLLLIFFIILLSTSISFSEDRFSNSDGKKNEKSLSEVLKWSWSREEPKKEFIETNETGIFLILVIFTLISSCRA